MRSPPATRVGAGGDKLPGPSNLLAALECAGGVPSERAFVVDDRRQKTLAVEPHGAGACIRAPDSDEARSCHRRRGKKTSLGRYVPCSVRIELISLPERLQRATRQRSPKSCRRSRHTEPNKSLLHISLWRRRRENRRGHPDRLDWVTNGHGVFRMTGSRCGMRPHSRAEAHQLEKFPTSFVGGGRISGCGAHLLGLLLHNTEDSRRCRFCLRGYAPWPLRSDHHKNREKRWAQHNREARHKGKNRRRSAHPIYGRQPLFGHRNSLNKKVELKLTAEVGTQHQLRLTNRTTNRQAKWGNSVSLSGMVAASGVRHGV